MLDGLFGKKCWPIALDIGTDGVRMLQMRRVGGTISVSACARCRFPSAAAQDPLQWRRLAVEAVRDILRKGDFRGNRVVSALPSSQLRIKNIRLPSMPQEELVQAIRWEARERFGHEFAPDQLHYLEAGEVRQGNEICQELILVAAPQEVVDGHLATLKDMGLVPDHIEAEPVAVFRPFERTLRRRADENAISVVLDVGHSATKVVVARGRRIVLIKAIDIGGMRLAQAVAKQLNMSYEEARELRAQAARESAAEPAEPGDQKDPSGDPKAHPLALTVRDALRGVVEDLSREIALCLRYCAVTFRGLRPERLVVAGGEAYDPAVVQLLGEQLGVECVAGQPLRGTDTSEVDFGGDRRGTLAEWTVCAGLAFRQEPWQQSLRKQKHERHRLSA